MKIIVNNRTKSTIYVVIIFIICILLADVISDLYSASKTGPITIVYLNLWYLAGYLLPSILVFMTLNWFLKWKIIVNSDNRYLIKSSKNRMIKGRYYILSLLTTTLTISLYLMQNISLSFNNYIKTININYFDFKSINDYLHVKIDIIPFLLLATLLVIFYNRIYNYIWCFGSLLYILNFSSIWKDSHRIYYLINNENALSFTYTFVLISLIYLLFTLLIAIVRYITINNNISECSCRTVRKDEINHILSYTYIISTVFIFTARYIKLIV